MLDVKCKSSGNAAKKRQAITLETKLNIIKRVEQGKKMAVQFSITRTRAWNMTSSVPVL